LVKRGVVQRWVKREVVECGVKSQDRCQVSPWVKNSVVYTSIYVVHTSIYTSTYLVEIVYPRIYSDML
jgi:hypothetical protein